MTHNFTATGVSSHILARHQGTVSYEVSGTFVGTVRIETSKDGGMSWQVRVNNISAAVDASFFVEVSDSSQIWVRLRCTSYTSGTIETEILATDPSTSVGGGGDGVWGSITGTLTDQTDLVAVLTDKLEAPVDLASEVDGVLPIANGGTNSSTALGGSGKAIVSDATKIIEHATTTATEVGYLAGVTSAIQTQLNAKAPLISPVFATSTRHDYATASTVPYFDASKDLVSSAVTPTELGYVSGVTSAIQTQLGTKLGGALGATDNIMLRSDGTGGITAQGSPNSIADTTGDIQFPADGGVQFNGSANIYMKSLASFESGTLLITTAAANRSFFVRINSVTKFGITNSDMQVYTSIYNVSTGRFGYTSESSLPTPFPHCYFQQMWVDEGTNKSQGLATLVGGTVTVSTTQVLTGDRIVLSRQTPGGTEGFLSAPTASITNATSFVINSSSGTDTSTVFWMIYHPY